MESGLIFAPLIRVSTEAQEKRGESLQTQHKQLECTIQSLKGEIYRWYSGQEHATPEQERKTLNELLRDAGDGKFNAVIVCDTSRWSRDNKRSKGDLEYLKEKGIRFFVGSSEFFLDNPMHNFILGMGVEVEEFFAAQQNYKSIINCIAKAKKGYPTKGKLPYGRTFNKETGQWGLDQEKQQKVKYTIDRYLDGTSMRVLSNVLGICWNQVHYLFSKCLGEDWQIKFTSKNFNISETVQFKIPPLVSDDIIDKVKEKLAANKTFTHGQLKNQYLLGRMIFCGHCGYALVGAEYHGRLYYRHQGYRNCGAFGSIRADDIEDNVFETMFENFGDAVSISESIKKALPDLDKIKLLNHQMNGFKQEMQNLKTQRNRLINAISDGIITNEDVSSKMTVIREKESTLEKNIFQIQDQISSMPTEQQINRTAQLMQRTFESYCRCDARKEDMTFEDKRRLLQDLLSGKTTDGKRAGVFITINKFSKRPWQYEIKGTLSLYSLRGYIKTANLNMNDKNNPGNCKGAGHPRPRSHHHRGRSFFQFQGGGADALILRDHE